MRISRRRRFGFFTRVLEEAPAADRYRFAVEQIARAEQAGFDTAWVAQHHFHRDEGGLPSPFVLLAYAAAYTARIVLGTAIVALPLEDPVRVAEDAAVLTRLTGGRFELGVGSGSTPSAFAPFGADAAHRRDLYETRLRRLEQTLAGAVLTDDDGTLYPAAPELRAHVWEATGSEAGAARAGAAGNGLMLARTQRRGPGQRTLADAQRPLVDAYLRALPADVAPRILVSRSVFVSDDRVTARALAARGLERAVPLARARGIDVPTGLSATELLAALDVSVGTPEEIVDALAADDVAVAATDVVFQVHPVDPAHELVLRSLELVASRVMPALPQRLLTA